MDKNSNAIHWFEISAAEFQRAKTFYEAIFAQTMEMRDMPGARMAVFPTNQEATAVGGAIVQSEQHSPSMSGTLVYLNANPDLSVVLGRVESAGGKILMPKTHISDEIGYMVFFVDSAGNRRALHSCK